MNAIGIVAEFNPFHSGHSYLIRKTREKFPDSVIVAVMSGNFVQRGEAAFEDKWRRSSVAVKNGVDLVVQLPTRFSNASSYFFAYGAMEILTSLNVGTVVFGSESGDTDRLGIIAEFLTEHFDDVNKYAALRTKEGITYPRAREEYLNDFFSAYEKCHNMNCDMETSKKELTGGSCYAFPPNEILAIDYMIAGNLLGYDGSFYSFKRSGDGHNESASKIRREYYSKNPDKEKHYEDTLYKLIVGKISASKTEKKRKMLPENCRYAEGELYNRTLNRWRYTKNLEELEDELVSKSYTRARVRRFFISYVLGNYTLHKEDILSFNAVYPLAFNDKGASYLKFIKKIGISHLDFIHKVSPDHVRHDECQSLDIIAHEEIVATDVYNLLRGNDFYEYSEFVKKPEKI